MIEEHAIEVPDDTVCRCKCGFEGKYEQVQNHIRAAFHEMLDDFFHTYPSEK